MDQMPLQYTATVPPSFYFNDTYMQYPPAMPFHPMQQPFPSTPTISGMQMAPDTTVQSGSDFGDTPPSSSSSSNPPKRKFKSPEEEKKYLRKRKNNNEAARKSRIARKDRETILSTKNHILEKENAQLKFENEQLKMQLAAFHQRFYGENFTPASCQGNDTKAFQGMRCNSMNSR